MEPPMFRDALRAAGQRDRTTAFQLMRQVLLDQPRFVPAWIELSKLVDDLAQQRECLERALALAPDNIMARDRLEQVRVRELLHDMPIFPQAVLAVEQIKLGKYLIEQGIVTEAQVQIALEEQQTRQRSGRPILLGEMLLQLGHLTPARLAQMLVAQTLARVQGRPTARNGKAQTIAVQRIGDYLIAEGVISPTQLETALIEQLKRRQQGDLVMLGQILVQNSCLTYENLEQLLERQQVEYYGAFH